MVDTNYNQFVKDWWKQAQNSPPPQTKITLRRKLEKQLKQKIIQLKEEFQQEKQALQQDIQDLENGATLQKVLKQRDQAKEENNTLILARNQLQKENQAWEKLFNTLLNKYDIKSGKVKDLTDFLDNLLISDKEQKETIRELQEKVKAKQEENNQLGRQFDIPSLNKISTDEREIEKMVSQSRKLFWKLETYWKDNFLGKNNKNIEEVVKKMKDNPIFREPIE